MKMPSVYFSHFCKQGLSVCAHPFSLEITRVYTVLLMFRVEEFGELSVEAAQAYYEYGNALLIQQEENPSDNLLGGNENQPLETQESVEIDETAAADDGDEEDADDEDKGEDDDLQIAWENLDVRETIRSLISFAFVAEMKYAFMSSQVARIILEKDSTGNERILSSVSRPRYIVDAGANLIFFSTGVHSFG